MPERQFACFRLEGSLFGVNILLVREILRAVEFTPVELAPEGVRGLLNLRGQILPVVDLAPQLGLAPRTVTPLSRCLVLKTMSETAYLREQNALDDVPPREPLGILVDEVSDIVMVDDGELQPLPANLARGWGDHLAGVVRLEKELLLVISVRALLGADARFVGGCASPARP